MVFPARMVVLTLAAALGSCAAPAGEGSPAARELREVQEALAGLIRADNEGDLVGVVASYASDAVLIPPEGQEIVGSEEIRVHYSGIFAQYRMNVSLSSTETRVLGEGWAMDRGVTGGSLEPRGGGEVLTVRDHYLALLRRGDDGSWRVARLIWNAAPPQPPRP